jgi:hypothetical protein
VKLTWDKPSRYSPIIGDAGVNFIKQDIELDLNDYAVFADSVPPAIDDQQNFQQIILAAIQSGSLRLDDAMELLMEKDTREGLMRFSKKMREREIEQMQQQQAQMAMQQQQMQAQAQMKQAELQGKQQIQDSVNQTELMKEQMGNRSQEDRNLIKVKGSLAGEEMKSLSNNQ